MALSEERKAQLMQMVMQIQGGQTPQVSPTAVAERAGITGPITKSVSDKLAAQAIEEGSAPFKQTQEERTASLGRFGGLGGEQTRTGGSPTGIEIAPTEDYLEVPVARTEEGGIQSEFIISPEAELRKQRQEAEIEGNEQLRKSKLKGIAETKRDLTNARLKIGTAFDTWLNVIDRTKKITGVDPGIFGGIITEVLGKTKANEYVASFKGGLIEYAAAIAKISMPSSRAVRLIDLFKQTAPTTFDTVPSAIEQSALSFRNGLSTAMSREPESFIPGFTGTDEEYSQLDQMLRDFQNNYREGLYQLALDKNPELVPEDVRARLKAEQQGAIVPGFGDDDINALLDRLGAE